MYADDPVPSCYGDPWTRGGASRVCGVRGAVNERIIFVGLPDDAARLQALLAPELAVIHLDADAARPLVARREVALLILGFGKPWLADLPALTRLHATCLRHPLKVLALVPRDDPAGLERAFDSGVADCAGWPIDPAELRARVRMLLQRQRTAEQRRLEALAARRRADTDALTGVANRHMLDATLADAVRRARVKGTPLALLMLDIDDLKPINDWLGHVVGDVVLRTIAGSLVANVRAGDCVARFGGDELAVVMPDTDSATAHAVASRLCGMIAATEFGCGHPVTVSIGVAMLADRDADGAALLARADSALYAAKRSGRNRVERAVAA